MFPGLPDPLTDGARTGAAPRCGGNGRYEPLLRGTHRSGIAQPVLPGMDGDGETRPCSRPSCKRDARDTRKVAKAGPADNSSIALHH